MTRLNEYYFRHHLNGKPVIPLSLCPRLSQHTEQNIEKGIESDNYL